MDVGTIYCGYVLCIVGEGTISCGLILYIFGVVTSHCGCGYCILWVYCWCGYNVFSSTFESLSKGGISVNVTT